MGQNYVFINNVTFLLYSLSTASHQAEKNKAEEQIKILQLQILDRDKAICTFVDETKEEGR